VLQILTERIDFGRTLPQAIADPRGSQRNPAATATNPNSPTAPEQAFLDRYRTALEARGHTFSAPAEIGAATGIEFLPGGGFLAAAEPVRRGGGSAQVVRP
jgi:gamma-glutamyltranspeptidase/glutathione hydrolase